MHLALVQRQQITVVSADRALARCAESLGLPLPLNRLNLMLQPLFGMGGSAVANKELYPLAEKHWFASASMQIQSNRLISCWRTEKFTPNLTRTAWHAAVRCPGLLVRTWGDAYVWVGSVFKKLLTCVGMDGDGCRPNTNGYG